MLPVFGQITPFPATPLYDRLAREGLLTRPKHWLEFAPFRMAHTPKKMAIDDVQDEVRYAWMNAYSPVATERALESIKDEPVPYKISHMALAAVLPRDLFPQEGRLAMAQTDRARTGARFCVSCASLSHSGMGPRTPSGALVPYRVPP